MKKLILAMVIGITAFPVHAQVFSSESLGGAALGGLIGGIVGHNTGGRTAEGVAIGAASGFLPGAVAERLV